MGVSITDKLEKLIEANASFYATRVIVSKSESKQGSYRILIGNEIGAIDDMVRLNSYLSQAGLSPNNLNPHFERNLSTDNGPTQFGVGNGKGGFDVDRVALSDNIKGIALAGLGFGLDLDFKNFSEKEISHKIDEAIRLQKMDNHLKTGHLKGEKQNFSRAEELNSRRRNAAEIASNKELKSEADHVATVTRFIKDTVHQVIPDADVKVEYKTTESRWGSLKNGGFAFTVTFKNTSANLPDLESSINGLIEKKIPQRRYSPRAEVTTYGSGYMNGVLAGSPAQVAAQIEGVKLDIRSK